MKSFLLVFLGGGLGSLLRFLINQFIKSNSQSFPWATLLANLVGCFFIGIIVGWALKNNLLKTDFVLFLTVGFAGGLTTFSTYALESIFLFKENFLIAFLYLFTSIFLGLIFVVLGIKLGINIKYLPL